MSDDAGVLMKRGTLVRILGTGASTREYEKRIAGAKVHARRNAGTMQRKLTILRQIQPGQEFRVINVIGDLRTRQPCHVTICYKYARISLFAHEVEVV